MDYFGIDPGKKGGIAKLDGDGNLIFGVPMPARPDGWLYVRRAAQLLVKSNPAGSAHYAIEKAQSMPKQSSSATARYMTDYGKLCAILELWPEVPHRHYPRPQHWKVILGGGTNKQAAINFVKQRHPDFNLVQPRARTPHNGIADAICIAHWCRMQHLAGKFE